MLLTSCPRLDRDPVLFQWAGPRLHACGRYRYRSHLFGFLILGTDVRQRRRARIPKANHADDFKMAILIGPINQNCELEFVPVGNFRTSRRRRRGRMILTAHPVLRIDSNWHARFYFPWICATGFWLEIRRPLPDICAVGKPTRPHDESTTGAVWFETRTELTLGARSTVNWSPACRAALNLLLASLNDALSSGHWSSRTESTIGAGFVVVARVLPGLFFGC